MKGKIIFALFALLFMPGLAWAGKKFVIDKQTCIVADMKASPVIVLASAELQHFIHQTTGLHVPIISNPAKGEKHCFVHGC